LAFVTRKNKWNFRHCQKNNFYLLNNPSQSKKSQILLINLYLSQKRLLQGLEPNGIEKMTLLFGNQLFGLIQRKSTDKSQKPMLTLSG
jgi:hypothetical protein